MPRYRIIQRDIREYQFIVEADNEQEAIRLVETEPADNDYMETSAHLIIEYDMIFTLPVDEQIARMRSLARNPEAIKRMVNDRRYIDWLMTNRERLLAMREESDT